MLRDAKPAPSAGGGKKSSPGVARLRSRRRLRRRSSVRRTRSRARWARSGQQKAGKSRHGCNRSALSAAPTTALLAPSQASPSLSTSRRWSCWLSKIGGETQNGGPGFSMFALMSRRVRGRVEDVGRSDRGNPYLSVKLDDLGFAAPIGSMRAWSRRTRRIWHCHLFPAAVPSTRTGQRSSLVEVGLCRANVRRRQPLRQGWKPVG